MALETILLFLVTDMMFCLTPGPATLVIVSHALPHGPAGGMRGAFGPIVGVNVGNFLWYGLTAFGLIALIQAVPTAYSILRWVGVAYLLWMSFQMFQRRGSALARQSARSAGFRKGFLSGLTVQMSNPKALLFYSAVIPPFIDPDGQVLLQFAILAGLTVITETTGLSFYASLATRARKLGRADQAQPLFQKIAATVLIAAALILAWWNLTDSAVQSAFNLTQGKIV
ncbi:MAG: LysE family translocator [Sphingomonadales bacterium]|nr:LysE family translocator [Sphingomonadales bacterium]PIX64678.1 MAG: lysine transporter LysE [Sphingomonadales bacterium CG_4_10_14_3_um_filter_58_15]NCO48444.1 LysE family translocator [Sphingomonadales bacterium]NCO99260.1 LysE family translocator [Sphingomonadales bacterium]NCP27708.1 LysE family translocator [Sphingomonadales bacterium]